MKAVIVGGNDFRDRRFVFWMLDRLRDLESLTHVVTSDAAGAAQWTREWADIRKVTCEVVAADPAQYPKKFILIRNKKMLRQKPELVVAFAGGDGTSDMIRTAKASNVPVLETWQIESRKGFDADVAEGHLGYVKSKIWKDSV